MHLADVESRLFIENFLLRKEKTGKQALSG